MSRTIIGNNRGVRDVAIQDQTTPILDAHLFSIIDSATLLAQQAIDDLLIGITTLTTPVIGDELLLKETDGNAFYQGEITSVASLGGDGYNVGVDSPLDFAFGVSDIAELTNVNLNVDGSVTPVIFGMNMSGMSDISEWDITRLLASMLGLSPMDDGLFGDLTALPKGIMVREKDGQTKNIFNAKTNGDVKEHAFDLAYADRAPSGQFGMGFRRSFNGLDKNGVVVRLTTVTNDGLQCIVQDDLTGLVSFKMTVQGHQVERGG